MSWLLKSEPDVYSIDQLKQDKTAFWEGVRNYQARNFLQSMKLKQLAFFYHSNCKVPGIYGLMQVIKESSPDPDAFDPQSPYFCSKSNPENPRWYGVDFKFIHKWHSPLSLTLIKDSELDFPLTRKGNRLSVIPIEQDIFEKLILMINSLPDNKKSQWKA